MGSAPFAFLCPVARRNRDIRTHRLPDGHARIWRTGRTKPNPSRRRGPRTLGERVEFVCECGHVGWTTHADVTACPHLDDPTRGREP